jgi:IS30 family transposase
MPSRYKKRKQIDQTIIELHEKGNTYRQIAGQLNVSFRDISDCIKRTRIHKKIADYRREEAVLEYKINFMRALLKDLQREEQRIRSEISNLGSKEA